jgi:hypothetical protein
MTGSRIEAGSPAAQPSYFEMLRKARRLKLVKYMPPIVRKDNFTYSAKLPRRNLKILVGGLNPT